MDEKAKVKFRMIDFELEGGDAAVQSSLRDLAVAFAQQNGHRAPPPPAPQAALSAGEPAKQPELELRPDERHSTKIRNHPQSQRCENCGDDFVPARISKPLLGKWYCQKPDCRSRRACVYAKDHNKDHKESKKTRIAPGNADLQIGPKVANQENGVPRPEVVLKEWARAHHGRLDVFVALPDLAASGAFGGGNRASVRNKALALLNSHPGFTWQEDLIYKLVE